MPLNFTEPPTRTVDERIARLRRRLKDAKSEQELRNIIAGLLDLLDDEL